MARAVVAPRRRSAVGLLEQPHAVAVLPHDRDGAVGGPVIDANYFEILKGLRENAVHGAGDSRRRVVGGNDY